MRFLLGATVLWLGLVEGALGQLKFENIEASDGLLGPLREREGYYPNEDIYFRYVITGLKVNAEGGADSSLRLVVKDAEGKTLLDQENPGVGVLALGGATMPGNALVMLNDQAKPGNYSLTLTLNDKNARKEAKFTRNIKLLPIEFAVLTPRFSYDEEGEIPAPAGGLVGQTLHLQVKAIGFDRTKGRIDSEMKLEVLDVKGHKLMPQPIHAAVQTDEAPLVEKAPYLNFRAQFVLNRAGEFKLHIAVTDKVGNQSASFDVPFVVTAP